MKQKYMKSLFSLALFLCAIAANAYDFEKDGIFYNLNEEEGTASVTYGDIEPRSESSSYVENHYSIPETINYGGTTYRVTEIGGSAFSHSNISSIDIPESVVTIGEGAFWCCYKLTAITLPSKLKTIGDGSFGWSNLTSITIPNTVREIGNSAFTFCSYLTSVSIPSTIEYVGGRAFRDTPWYYSLPDGMIYLGKCFYTCKGSLPNDGYITIKDGIQSISSEALIGRGDLISISIPNSVTCIGQEAFGYCSNLKSCILPEKLQKIEYATFWGCQSLTSINIPNSISSIDENAFTDCKSLQSVVIPGSVKIIGHSAFDGCFDLSSVILSEGIERIEARAFGDCPKLRKITFPSSIKYLDAGGVVGSYNYIWEDNFQLIDEIYSLIEDPTIFGYYYGEGGYLTSYNSTATVYIPLGTKELYRNTYEKHNPFITFVETLFRDIDYDVPETGTNTLNAAQIIEKANAGKLYVTLQNHTTSANQYINEDGFTVDKNSVFGHTTWEVVKYGDGYALKNSRGLYLKGTTRPAQLTSDISEATLYMPEDAEANIVNIAPGYNSSMAVRWKVLPEKDKWINTNASSSDVTIQWNNGTGCWTCIFTYEVKKEQAIDVTYVLMEDGQEIDRQTIVQLSNSDYEMPESWDQHLYDYTPDGSIGQYDCTITFIRTHKTKVYETEFVRQSSVAAGQTYAIFNTAVNGTENRYGFYYAYSSSQLGCNPVKPSEFPGTDEYLWEVEGAGSGLLAFKNKSTGTYINASQRVLGESTGWLIEEWTRSSEVKAPVNSLNENEEIIPNASISADDKVFIVTNPNASGKARYWNGNDITGGNVSMPALWDKAHPFAFYRTEQVLYVFNTYILQESDGTELDRQIIKQKAYSELEIPTEWMDDTEYVYTTSGSVGDDGSVIVVTRTKTTGMNAINNLIESGSVIYNLQGQRIANPQRGQVVIIRHADGTSKKVLLK